MRSSSCCTIWILVLAATGILIPSWLKKSRFDIIGTVKAITACQWDAAQFQIAIEQIVLDQGGALRAGVLSWVFVSWGLTENPSVDIRVGDRVEVSGRYLSSHICAASLATEPSGIKKLSGEAEVLRDILADEEGHDESGDAAIEFRGIPDRPPEEAMKPAETIEEIDAAVMEDSLVALDLEPEALRDVEALEHDLAAEELEPEEENLEPGY
jgi:hypothetical protein